MKAVTLTQPFATLISLGQKRIETRSWSTNHRGPLAIHAAAGLGPVGGWKGLRDMCFDPVFFEAIKAASSQAGPFSMHHEIEALPLGAIIAVCTLLDCVPTQHPGAANEPGKPWFTGARKGVGQHYYEVPPPLDSNEYAFGDYSPGRFAWLLGDIRALPEPIPVKGQLGLFNLPPEVLERLESVR